MPLGEVLLWARRALRPSRAAPSDSSVPHLPVSTTRKAKQFRSAPKSSQATETRTCYRNISPEPRARERERERESHKNRLAVAAGGLLSGALLSEEKKKKNNNKKRNKKRDKEEER